MARNSLTGIWLLIAGCGLFGFLFLLGHQGSHGRDLEDARGTTASLDRIAATLSSGDLAYKVWTKLGGEQRFLIANGQYQRELQPELNNFCHDLYARSTAVEAEGLRPIPRKSAELRLTPAERQDRQVLSGRCQRLRTLALAHQARVESTERWWKAAYGFCFALLGLGLLGARHTRRAPELQPVDEHAPDARRLRR